MGVEPYFESSIRLVFGMSWLSTTLRSAMAAAAPNLTWLGMAISLKTCRELRITVKVSTVSIIVRWEHSRFSVTCPWPWKKGVDGPWLPGYNVNLGHQLGHSAEEFWIRYAAKRLLPSPLAEEWKPKNEYVRTLGQQQIRTSVFLCASLCQLHVTFKELFGSLMLFLWTCKTLAASNLRWTCNMTMYYKPQNPGVMLETGFGQELLGQKHPAGLWCEDPCWLMYPDDLFHDIFPQAGIFRNLPKRWDDRWPPKRIGTRMQTVIRVMQG